MRLCIFDTETTGLPKSRLPSFRGPNNWPHIVSISWVILNAVTNIIDSRRHYIIKPNGWTIPQDAIKIHGITNEKAHEEGGDLGNVVDEFLAQDYDVLVSHNLDFDFNVLDNAIRWDLHRPWSGIRQQKMCTMELSRDLCRIPRPLGDQYKAPKLMELYQHAFRRKPVSASLHNSLYDTLILTEVIQHCDGLRLKMNLPPKPANTVENVNPKNDKGFLPV